MGRELTQTFTDEMRADDVLVMSDPVYYGGTVDRSVGSETIVVGVIAGGGRAEHVPDRAEAGRRLAALARPGDRIAIMGARDDTLTRFAAEVLASV
jgi:UDP-N-acetylmuramate--alanine ligase